MEKIAIYGFGSFFNKKDKFQDIDILIFHQSTSFESCQFSLCCKRYMLANLSGAHITILSKIEERQLSFIKKSKAKFLGNVFKNSAKDDLENICNKIKKYNSVIREP